MSVHHEHPPQQTDKSLSTNLATRNSSVNWVERTRFPRYLLNSFERFSLIIEKLINYWVREQIFNPLYHTGTITVLLLFVILGTGVYLTMFYQFGFEASYQAVANIQSNFIGRIMRALHRYASGGAVIFAVLHGWRTFFQDRFRGPRWLAWVSGVLMAFIFWLIGVSGYWMVWDQRAQVLNQTLINLLNGAQVGTNFLVHYLVTKEAGTGWVFMLLVTTVHLGLSALLGLFYWLHIKRLSRPKWLPPRYWVIAIVGLLLLASALIPVGTPAPIDTAKLPANISRDLFFLFYLPAGLNWRSSILWGSISIIVFFTSVIPWILTREKRAPIVVDADRCTGCTLCANDCPYKAITIIERKDNNKHKLLAKIDPQLCVACGICVGTCTPLAMTFEERPADHLWKETLSRISKENKTPVIVTFTCERHVYQGARPYLQKHSPLREEGDPLVQVVPLTCIGMAHPNLATQALASGAYEVQFIGCPPEDCANREGNLWLQKRLTRERKPRLNQKFKNAPIYSNWAPPNDFKSALEKPGKLSTATSYHLDLAQFKWRYFIPSILFLVVLFSIQIWMSDRPYQPYSNNTAFLEVTLNHKAGYPIKGVTTNPEAELGLEYPTRLIVKTNNRVILDKSYPPQGDDMVSIAFEQFPLGPGDHQIKIIMWDRPRQNDGQILYDGLVSFENRGILKLSYFDAQISGDPMAGRDLFFESSLGVSASCHICHSLDPGAESIGPSLAGIGLCAAERVDNLSAEAYLRESIVDPDAYIVEGYSPGLMLPDLDEKLSEEQIDNLIAFLLSMK